MEVVNKGRVRDVLLLDTLVRLAEIDDNTDNRPLEEVLKDYNTLYAPQDPIAIAHKFGRHFFGPDLGSSLSHLYDFLLASELIVSTNQSLELKDPLFASAIKDVIAILPAYRALNVKAVNKMNELHTGLPNYLVKRC